MLTFEDFRHQERFNQLQEVLIQLGGQRYPKFNTVVIMAGGAGSGKGFIIDKLLGVEGYTFDVDELKKMAAKAPLLQQRIKKEFGVSIEDLSLKNPENVSRVHEIISSIGLGDRRLVTFFKSAAQADNRRKPNLIFDTTLASLSKMENAAIVPQQLGYDKKDIHLIWTINNIEVAKRQNKSRDRVVPTEILINTHRGASQSVNDLINMGSKIRKYMDGDIVFAFNQVDVDSELIKGDDSNTGKVLKSRTKSKPHYLKSAEYFYIKRQGKSPMNQKQIEQQILSKISEYVPKNVSWS